MPTLHTAVVNTERGVWDDQFLVDADNFSEALANWAGSQWGVEGKQIVAWFFENNAVGFEAGREIVTDV